MKSRARLSLSFEDPTMAAAVVESLSRRRTDALRIQVRGKTIIAETTAVDPMSLLPVLDEWLARVNAFEREARATRSEPSTRRRRP